MKLSTFMVFAALVSVIFGLGFILAPSAVMNLYGTTLNVGSEFMGRYLGATFIGVACLVWFTRNAPASETRTGVLTAFFIMTVLGFLVALWDKFAGSGARMVWVNVILYLLLAVGFGYFRFMKKD